MRLRSRSFDAWALDYDRYRPTCPQSLFDHIAARLALPEQAVVADVGAGTGKAARQMGRRGWQVTALDPGERMLEVLRARAAADDLAIEARLASAEETGLADASVDLVTAAQAFHWFDKPRGRRDGAHRASGRRRRDLLVLPGWKGRRPLRRRRVRWQAHEHRRRW